MNDAMEITVTCHPWSLKITILGTKWLSRKMGAYHHLENQIVVTRPISADIFKPCKDLLDIDYNKITDDISKN